MAFDVHVVNDDQDGVSGIRVMLSFTSLLRGNTDYVYTDKHGHAEFDNYDEGQVTVFVDGTDRGKYRYENGESITIAL